MADFDRREFNKLIADCKESGGRELDLIDLNEAALDIGDDAMLFDEVLHVIVQQLPDLECLTLESLFEGTTLEVLAKHAEHLPDLLAIDLFAGDGGLQALAAHAKLLPMIRSLSLDVGDDGLKTLAANAEHFSGLRVIESSSCTFGDEGLCALAAQAKHFVNLERFVETDASELQVTAKGCAALLRNLTGLKVLALNGWPIGNVGLKALASQGKGLASLEALDLSSTNVGDSGVKALAAQAKYLDNLQTLNFGHTKLGDDGLKALALEWQAGHLRCLEGLNVTNTPVTSVAPEVLKTESAEQIFEAVLDGLASPEAKIVVLGEPGAGKTSLCDWFFRFRLADSSQRRETDDFELITPSWRTQVRDLYVQLKVWDFGGQHVLHGTHEMFLTSRSLCLLVLDATQVEEHGPEMDEPERDGNRLSYWLKMIRHFVGADAHVILVNTKCDDEESDRLRSIDDDYADRLRIKHRFNRPIRVVEGFSATDETTARANEELLDLIKDELALMDEPHSKVMDELHRKVPREFVALKQHVQSRVAGRALVNLQVYRQWCRDFGIKKQSKQDVYLRTLHHFGSVFYFGLLDCDRRQLEKLRRQKRSQQADEFPEGQSRLLKAERDTVLQHWLINPHWLKHPVYELIRESERLKPEPWLAEDEIRKAAQRTRGEITITDPAAAGDVVQAVLKLTELCFYDAERGTFFFPRGLQSKSFLTGWDESSRHEVTWQSDFFPEAVIHRFIVQAHRHKEVHKNAQWRTGAVLKRGGAMAAIQSEPENGKVKVWLKSIRTTNRNRHVYRRSLSIGSITASVS